MIMRSIMKSDNDKDNENRASKSMTHEHSNQNEHMHMKQIMGHTILKRLDHVTGVVSSEPLPADPSEIDDGPRLELKEGELPFSSRRQGASLIYKFLNADPRMPRVGHYCQGWRLKRWPM